MKCTMAGMVRGSGQQAKAVGIILVSYWIVGVPLALALAFKTSLGVRVTNSCACSRSAGASCVGLLSGKQHTSQDIVDPATTMHAVQTMPCSGHALLEVTLSLSRCQSTMHQLSVSSARMMPLHL